MKIKNLLILLLFTLSSISFAEITYGICAQGVVPVRRSTDNTSEQVTQLIFGDGYKILKKSERGDWLYIQNLYDNYEGWIRKDQHFAISAWYYEQLQNKSFPICADMKGYVSLNGKRFLVSIGSTLPFYRDGKIKIGTQEAKFEGKTAQVPEKLDRDYLIATAKRFLQRPYLWGGKSEKGVDCSGFTQLTYKIAGYKIPRDSYQQAEKGKIIPLEEARAGDLAFFHREGRVIHVGIVLGDGKIIHSSDEVQIDTLDKTGIYNARKKKYSHYLKFIKRLD